MTITLIQASKSPLLTGHERSCVRDIAVTLPDGTTLDEASRLDGLATAEKTFLRIVAVKLATQTSARIPRSVQTRQDRVR